MKYVERTVKNKEVAELMANITGSDCYKCEELEREQNFTVTDAYEEDECGGAYPIIFCHNCNEHRESGDSSFHEYFKIEKDEYGYTIDHR